MKKFLRWLSIPFAYVIGAIVAGTFLARLFRYTFLWGIFLEVKNEFTISGNIIRQFLGYGVLIIFSAGTSFGSIYFAMLCAPKYKKATGLVISILLTIGTIFGIICLLTGITSNINSMHITSSIIAIITSFITTTSLYPRIFSMS